MRMRPWSRSSDDEGFTLLEMTVAMMIIGVVIATLVALQISELKTVTVARQRQAATALADQKIERLRALPYTAVQAGLLASDVAVNDTRIVNGRLTGWNEAVVVSQNQTQAELKPHVQPVTQNGVTYNVFTYITHPVDPVTGADSTSTVDFWLTVITSWSSSQTGGKFKNVTVRTRVSYPAGCTSGGGSVDHPYAGPCQPFFYGTAGRSAGGITIDSPDTSGATPPINGLPFDSAGVLFANYSTQIGVEQTTSALSKLFESGIQVDSSTTGQNSTSAVADIDPATAVASGPFNNTAPTSSSASTQISGTNGVLTLVRSGVATGSAVQSTVASTSGGGCQDLAGTVLATNQPCASSELSRVGGNEADLDLTSYAGRDLPAFVLASMTPDASATRSFSGRFLTAGGGHCAGTSGDGCVATGVSRAISSFSVGGLPTGGSGGDTVPSNFAGMVTGSAYADSATTEAGVNSAAPNTTNFSTTRTGAVKYWNGNGYSTADLTAAHVYTLPTTTAAYMSNGNPAITISMTGQLSVGAPSTSKQLPTNCQPTACTSSANAGSLTSTITYTISFGSNQIANFTVSLDLGSVIANTTYRAVPSA